MFGSQAFAKIPDATRVKLDTRFVECIILGYSALSKGNKLQNNTTGKIIVSHNVSFNEDYSLAATCTFLSTPASDTKF